MPASRRWRVPGALLALLLGGGCPLTADESSAIIHLPRTPRDVASPPEGSCGHKGETCCGEKTCEPGLTCNEKEVCASP